MGGERRLWRDNGSDDRTCCNHAYNTTAADTVWFFKIQTTKFMPSEVLYRRPRRGVGWPCRVRGIETVCERPEITIANAGDVFLSSRSCLRRVCVCRMGTKTERYAAKTQRWRLKRVNKKCKYVYELNPHTHTTINLYCSCLFLYCFVLHRCITYNIIDNQTTIIVI